MDFIDQPVGAVRAIAGRNLRATRKAFESASRAFRSFAPLDFGRDSSIQQRAVEVAQSGVFLGGPPALFHAVGCHQLVTLLECGLTPQHRLLDVGCGCLRGGYWVMHFLDRGRYFGIEPNRDMLALGLREFISADTVTAKAPRFDHNSDFDFGVFSESFDFVVARSVWSHAAPTQIEKMLDEFRRWSTPKGIFLTSYHRAGLLQKQYEGATWVGRSHKSDVGGLVRYHYDWVVEKCRACDLKVRELPRNILDQIWLKIERE